MIKEPFFLSKDLQQDLQADIPQIHHLYKNLFSQGKSLRANMTFQTSRLLNIPKDKAIQLSRIVEYIHQSSILHDDVIDMSPFRRGGLSAWMQHSIKKAVLAGDYLLAISAGKIADMDNIALMKLTAETLKKLVKGEWKQSFLKGKETLSEINAIHALKTASLFQWILRAPVLVVQNYDKSLHSALDQIGLTMGILFQRADDLLDFDIRNEEKKSVFKDLSEGYFNSFSVYLIEAQNPDIKLSLKNCRCLNQVKKAIGEPVFKQILSSFDETNSQMISDCENKLKSLKNQMDKSWHPVLDYLQQWPKRLYWR